MPVICDVEGCDEPAALKRPKSGHAMCKECFFAAFEYEIHMTIVNCELFKRGDKVAMGASGGKDSTVLAHIMKLLNERYDYGLELFLLSIDEGITGYRDDSLETVKQNRDDYQLPLTILSYKDLYGWTMDEIVAQIGNKNNCTFCGTFRRQALDRGAALLGADMIVTGHNADDIAETVIMNIFRGDYARLSRCTNIITQGEGSIPRCKPLKFAYEKEIVMYAHYKKLVYFSTECKYAPNAYRGHVREYIKDLERVRPTCILDIIHSGENMELSKSFKLPERRTCTRCGFVASQEVCKACVLLEGLNTGNPKLGIGKSNKAKRAMGLKVHDGSENKTNKTRDEKGVSKKRLRREEKKQKQLAMMCGGGGESGQGACGSGCGSQLPPLQKEEFLPNVEPICKPDHKKVTIEILEEWLDGMNFDNLVAIKDPDCGSDVEEEMCGDDCPTKCLTPEKVSDSKEDIINFSPVPSCSNKCENFDKSSCADSTSKVCCSVPSTSMNEDSKTSDTDTKENKEKTCNCPLELLENPNHPKVINDAEDNLGFDIHVFKSLMIFKHPEILDEIRKVEEETGKDFSSTLNMPSKTKKSDPAEPAFTNDEKDVSELTSRVKESVSLKSQSDGDKQLLCTTTEITSTESQSVNTLSNAEQTSEPAVVKANPIRKGASLITPEMMHKAPNTLDF